jgi:hypothetical protein
LRGGDDGRIYDKEGEGHHDFDFEVNLYLNISLALTGTGWETDFYGGIGLPQPV